MSRDRFVDRMVPETYADDPVVGIYGTDPDDQSAVWVPERLFQRFVLVAKAYGLHTFSLLGGSEPVRLNKAMIESLIEETDFVGARLNDELATTWANVLATRALSALAIPEPILTVEGE